MISRPCTARSRCPAGRDTSRPHRSACLRTSGHLDSLKVVTRCGWYLAAHTRRTVSLGTPAFLAIDRQLRWVSSAGVKLRVRSTISSIFACGMDGFRPRPGRTLPSLATPSSTDRARHSRDQPVSNFRLKKMLQNVSYLAEGERAYEQRNLSTMAVGGRHFRAVGSMRIAGTITVSPPVRRSGWMRVSPMRALPPGESQRICRRLTSPSDKNLSTVH